MARNSQTDLGTGRTEKRIFNGTFLGKGFEMCLGRSFAGLRTARLFPGLTGRFGSLGNDWAGGNGQVSLRSRGGGDHRRDSGIGQGYV